jgi:Flp pilus assembly protein TadG
MTKRAGEHGQALIVIVFAIIALFGMTALAIDGGNAYAERRRAQNAADAAALAGAVERINNNTPSWVNAVYASAKQNGYNNDKTSNTVQVYSPPISGTVAGNIEYIQVIITSHTKTYFAAVVGMSVITNRVEAVSRTKTPEYVPMFGGAAVVSLAPFSDCDNKRAFWVHAEATLDITGSGVFVNSNNPDCALTEQGEGSIRIKDGEIQVVGGASIQKPKLLTPYPPVTNAPQVSYPPPFYMPKANCSEEALVSEDGHSMHAGNWDDVFPPPGVDTLGAGLYCLNDGFTISGDRMLKGNGVTLKIEAGRVQIGGGVQLNLSAPDEGDLAGLLIYQPADNDSYLAINGGNEDSTIRGTILAPSALIRIKGNDSGYGFHSQIIGYRIEADGDSNVVISYEDDQNYDALTLPEIEFSR